MVMYIRTGGVSNAYNKCVMFIGSEPIRLEWRNNVVVIGMQPTGSERVLFINREPTSLDGRTERGPAHWEGSSEPQNRGNNILFDRLWSKQGPVHWLGGLAYTKMDEIELSSTSYGRNRVLLIGRAVA